MQLMHQQLDNLKGCQPQNGIFLFIYNLIIKKILIVLSEFILFPWKILDVVDRLFTFFA